EHDLRAAGSSQMAATEREALLAEHLDRSRRRLAELHKQFVNSGHELDLRAQRATLADQQLAAEQTRGAELATQLSATQVAHDSSRATEDRLTADVEHADKAARQAADELRTAQQELTEAQERFAQVIRECQAQER